MVLSRRDVLRLCAVAPGAWMRSDAGAMDEVRRLHNGIELPTPWPPRTTVLSREPLPPPPYLVRPPYVIPIDLGRQLFVDDFLIEETNLTRSHHHAAYHPDCPVLRPDRPWETKNPSGGHPAPTAMPFSDGVWYDPAEQQFKLWYMAGYCVGTAHATSRDGITWEKPSLDVVPGTNVVHTWPRDSGTVWFDPEDPHPERRYKLFLYAWPNNQRGLYLFYSADGIHWSEPVGRSGPLGDRSTAHYDPFRKVWVYSIREYLPKTIGRCRRYWENADVVGGLKWRAGEPPMWVGADRLDPVREDLKTPCQLYNLDCVAYESLMLGLFTIWRGQPRDRAKPNEVCVGFSRDGFHWHRSDRTAFIPVSENYGDWNWGNVQSAGGGCIIAGEQLYFYVSGRSGVRGSKASGTSSTGLATLRRDGFVSMDAGREAGYLLTRPVRFSGSHLFVNLAAPEGELRVEIIGGDGKPVPPYTRERCLPVRADSTCQPVRWQGADDLSRLPRKTVKFKFHLTRGRLFAFWVTSDPAGASGGFHAGGLCS